MKRFLLPLILSLILTDTSAQSYRFDSIPGRLKRGASAVVRTHQGLFTILKPGNATWHEKEVITLMNENADNLKVVSVPYDKFSKVNYLRGIVYDEKGEIIKTLGIMDVQDMSAFAGTDFYTDDREKYLRFPDHKYPYTIEWEYEVRFTGMLDYPEWEFTQPGLAVERSGIQVVIPKGMTFKNWSERLKNPADSVIGKNEKIYTWQEENIPADTRFSYIYRAKDIPPTLHLAPYEFVYGGIPGTLKSWKDFGEWNYKLINGRDALSEDQKQQVLKLISGARDDREKARRIYEYIQSNTRYVMVKLGIGGYQPAAASDVAKYGFGDCKALANYTRALLEIAGLTSYYTKVKAGTDASPINKDFVSQQFNHVILCVPLEKDSVWLECTSQTDPFNYLGTFTDNRDVLLVTPLGGKLVRTPGYLKGENVIKTTGIVWLNNFGKSMMKISTSYSGFNYETAADKFENSSDDELKRYIASDSRFSDINTSSVKYSSIKSEKPIAKLTYETTVNDFAGLTGPLLCFSPILNMNDFIPELPINIEISRGVTVSDSLSYNIPVGFIFDSRPSDVNVSNEFGRFSYKLETRDDKLICERLFELNEGKISLERFNDFRNFINYVAGKERELIVLKNK